MSIARFVACLTLAGLITAAALAAQTKPWVFKVNARENAAATPLKTGIKVTKGQRIRIEPNPGDKWHNKTGSYTYHGRSAVPHMYLEWGINETKGGKSRVKEDKIEVVADKDGELVLCCGDRYNTNDNSGTIRVTVTLLP